MKYLKKQIVKSMKKIDLNNLKSGRQIETQLFNLVREEFFAISRGPRTFDGI
jgi:hypothetical protein